MSEPVAPPAEASEPAASEPEAAGVPETFTVFRADGRRLTGIDGSKINTYNFHNPGFLSQGDLCQLGVLHQRFIHHLAARLSTFFRMECLLKTLDFSNSTFANFCQSLGNPTHLALFQVEPLRGVGIVEISLPLGHAMSDRLLGGKGRASNTEQTLTEIEITLLEDVVNLILVEWVQLWDEDSGSLRPHCIGHENSGRFLQTAAQDSVFVVLTMEVGIGEMVEKLQMGVPFIMVETIVKKLSDKNPSSDEAKPKQIQWRKPYASISVPVTAEWDVKEISLRDLLSIKEGDVMELPRSAISQTRIRISPTEEFLGTAGVQNGHIAVELSERVNTE